MRFLALAACVMVAACGGGQGDLVGNWECKYSANGMSFESDSTYLSNGRTSGNFVMSGSDSGNQLEMSGTYTGTWDLEGDQLTETAERMTIVTFSVNGRVVNDPALISRFEQSMVGQSDVAEIKALTSDTFVTSSSEGTTTCSR